MPRWLWLTLVACAAAAPFFPGLTGARIFYIRDLSLHFWPRHLWLRRTLLSGDWPLWDPYVGGGQSAVADALHQMFLLPVLALRLIGSETVSFNLWVLLPFPLAACGAWLFFARRFSAPAAALGAIAFCLSGPIVSTGNFPNMSWSVAAMPWVLWAVDRVAARPGGRTVATLAAVVAFQALAGEPVSFAATAALAFGFALFVAVPGEIAAPRGRRAVCVIAGFALGGLLSAIQLLPMVHAALLAERSTTILSGVWSLHPLALLETIALHFFGNYYLIPSLSHAPWMPLVNTGREPFFFSIYYGLPLFSLALFGLVAVGRSGWGVFWAAAGGASIALALGVYTPLYPALRDHVPLVASFRFPVKYLVVFSMAVAAGAAAGWDALRSRAASSEASRAASRAQLDAIAFVLMMGAIIGALSAAAIYFPQLMADRALALAKALDDPDGVPAAMFLLDRLPALARTGAPLALAAAVLLMVATRPAAGAAVARAGLYVLIVGDLLVRAWSINPVFDPAYLAEPEWLARTKADANARFYVGGKKDGTLDAWDIDSSRAYFNAPGLAGSASRAALSGQTAFYPSAWHGREMLSYDLPILWPHIFHEATDRFFEAERDARDRFLDRTGVRFRVLPHRLAAGHAPVVKVASYYESSLYDWGPGVGARASVVGSATTVADPRQQVDALFKPGWDSRATVMVEREPAPAGTPGAPVDPFATIVGESSNRVVVEAGAGAQGGYLVLLDSYADDWRATVDGKAATIVRANGLFRSVRLAAGTHVVEFSYRPSLFFLGAACSGIALVGIAALWIGDRRRDPIAGSAA